MKKVGDIGMIIKEQALKIAKLYLKDRKREYISIEEEPEKIFFEENEEIVNKKGEDEVKNLYVVSYHTVGYQFPESNYINIDADTGEVLYTIYKHGRVESWEEDENGNLLE